MAKPLYTFIIVLIVVLMLICLFETDRRFGGEIGIPNPYFYYVTAWPLSIFGTYNTLIRTCNPEHTHVFDVSQFPSHTILQRSWRDIQSEALGLYSKKDKLRNMNDLGTMGNFTTIDAEEGQWKVFVIKWFDKPLENARRQCPKTVALIEQCPDLRVAMFSILEPGKHIPPHKGPFTACARYHLGLKIPKDRENCYIEVNKERFTWEEGEAFIFDDTYIHSVYNNTDEPRIILFADMERPLKSPFLKGLNQYLCSNAMLSEFNKGVNEVSEKTKELFVNYDDLHY